MATRTRQFRIKDGTNRELVVTKQQLRRLLLEDENAKVSLGLIIGSDVQAWDDDLDDIAALTPTDSNIMVGDGTNWITESGATARTSLGLGTADAVQFATLGIGGVLTEGFLHVNPGGAGAVTAAIGADEVVIEVSASGGASILCPVGSTARMAFGTPDEANSFQFSWADAINLATLQTNTVGARLFFRCGVIDNCLIFDPDDGGATTATSDYDWDLTGNYLGVGTARTEGTIHCHTATAGSVTANTNADDLVVENSADSGISILAPAASNCNLYFGSPDTNIGAVVRWEDSDLRMQIGTNVTDADLSLRAGLFDECLFFDGSATAASSDYDWNLQGDLELDGALNHDGTTVGFYGTTPAVQAAAYTLNATAVLDRTLLASASATTLNNNNVLAAIITDLQAYGLLQ